MIGLGVVTYNRPDYFARVMDGVVRHLLDHVDVVHVYNDGSDPQHAEAYRDIYAELPTRIEVHDDSVNDGVAAAKNALLYYMRIQQADWLFLLEDDVVPVDGRAVTGYVAAAEASGFGHLAFHAHGPANPAPTGVDGPVTFWPSSVGAYTLYSRAALDDVGLFDEHFVNAFEHVEHTMRLADAGWTTGFPRFADATGSEGWLAEIPGAIEQSSITCRGDWQTNITAARHYWQATRPDTYNQIWPAP